MTFLLAGIEFSILFLAASIAIMLLFPRKIKEWVGDAQLRKEHLFPVVILFVQLLLVGVGIDWAATLFQINDTQNVQRVVGTLSQQPLESTLILVFSGLSEELFFRGILYTLMGPIVSIIGFGFFHMGYRSIIEVIGAILAGTILVRGREKYGSIIPGIGGHILYNLAIIFFLGI